MRLGSFFWWCIHVSKVWKYLQKIVKTRRKIVSGYPHAFFAGEFHSFLFISNQLNSLWIPFSTETSGTFFKVICWPIDVVWIIGFTFPSGFRIVYYIYMYHFIMYILFWSLLLLPAQYPIWLNVIAWNKIHKLMVSTHFQQNHSHFSEFDFQCCIPNNTLPSKYLVVLLMYCIRFFIGW